MMKAPKASNNADVRAAVRGHAPAEKRIETNLSFLSTKSALGDYPDTGESGDTYDAETMLHV